MRSICCATIPMARSPSSTRTTISAKDYLKVLIDGLDGEIAIVAEAPYQTTDPTPDPRPPIPRL